MATYKSSVKPVQAHVSSVYGFLSDMSNLKMFASQIPDDKVRSLEIDKDTVSFEVDTIGKVSIVIQERVENEKIVFGGGQTPVPFALTIFTDSKDAYLTEIQLVVEVDIPFFLKPMIGGKLEDGLEKAVEMMAMLPYATLCKG